MYNIYSTEGVVLKAEDYGEDDRQFTVLTKGFGLLTVRARGIRKLESKLRYSLMELAVLDISLVRGREMWRLSGAVLKRDIYKDLSNQPLSRAVLGRVSSFITRLVRGEERIDELYENFKNAAVFIADNLLNGDLLRNTEYLLDLRILYSLGYLGDYPDWKIFTSTPSFDSAILAKISDVNSKIVETINSSIRESQL